MDNRGILSGVFDFSFTHFIASRLIRLIYPLLLLLCLVGSLGIITSIVAMGSGFFGGVGMLIVGIVAGAVVFVLSAVYCRLLAELMIVLFRGVEYLREINEKTR